MSECNWCGAERDAPAAGPHVCDPQRIHGHFLKDKVDCWLVWQKAPDAASGGRPYLVAVDMTEEQAKTHKASVEMNGGLAIIERSWVNHLYGESMTVGYAPFRSMIAEMRDKARGG